MFSNFFSFVPTISETDSYYIVSGVNFVNLEKDLKSVYGTTIIAKKILIRLSSRRFQIHKFFTVELGWVLDDLVNNQPRTKQANFRVGLNTYRSLLEQVKTQTWLATTYNDYSPYNINKALTDFIFKPFVDQQAFLEAYSGIKFGFQLKGCLLDSVPGSGKALSLDTDLLTPTGNIKMGDVKVGDILIGKDGKPTKVTGVYPQGKKQLYKVVFKDDRSVECCEDHLWEIKHSSLVSLVTTKELIRYLNKEGSKKKIYIPLMGNNYNSDKIDNFKLDPYALGVLIGNSRLTPTGTKFYNGDRPIAKAVGEHLKTLGFKLIRRDSVNYKIIKEDSDPLAFNKFMEDLGVASLKSTEKSIPQEYIEGSRLAREELIKGLVDSLGTIEKHNNVYLNTTSKILADQFIYLVRSIGGTAKVSTKVPIFNFNGELKKGKLCYKILVKVEDPKTLFKHSNNLIKLEDIPTKSIMDLELVSITPSRIDEAQCISVDSTDKLFVCSSFIVTHNTYTSLVWSRMISKNKTIILVPKNLINDPWLDHLTPEGNRYCFKTPPKVWVSTGNENPLTSNAEFFIFYKEQMRNSDYKGISFDRILSTLSKNGNEPLKFIVDESHNYNEISSQQTQGMVRLGSNPNVSDVLCMSGTPLKAQGKETYPLFCMIDKYFDSKIRPSFLQMYSRDNYFLNEMLSHRLGRIKFTINAIAGMGTPPEPEVIKLKFEGIEKFTLKSIRAQMAAYIQERILFYKANMPNYLIDFRGYLNSYEDSISEDKQALAELAKYRNIVDYFRKNGYNNFTDSDKSKYCKYVEGQIELNLKGEDLKYFRHIKSAVKYLNLKIRGEALGNILGKARIEAIVESINHLNLAQFVKSGIKKTLIYSTYIEAINYAYDNLKTNGCSPLKLHSGEKNNIDSVVKSFDTSKYDCLVTSFDTLSEGYPLLMANQIILLNTPWREYILRQTLARVWRKGQDVQCFFWLVDLDTGTEENITTRSLDIMNYFKEQVEQLLGSLEINDGEGIVNTKFVDNSLIDFNKLIPFEIPKFNFRPKFKERSFSSLFR